MQVAQNFFHRTGSFSRKVFVVAMAKVEGTASVPRRFGGGRLCLALVCLGIGIMHSGLVAFCPAQAPRTRGSLMLRKAEGTTMEKPPAGSQWRLNVGRALDVLRRDMAGLFSRKSYTPDFSIYSPEIEVGCIFQACYFFDSFWCFCISSG